MRQSNKIGKSLERRVAKKVGGKVTIGSGNLPFDKEDVKNGRSLDGWLIQTKATDKDHYTLKLDDVMKVVNNAKKTQRRWAFVIEFHSGNDLERSCFYGISEEEAAKVIDMELMKDYNITDKKQIKLTKEEFEDNWLEDEHIWINFKKKGIDIFFLNEIDFVKLFINKK